MCTPKSPLESSVKKETEVSSTTIYDPVAALVTRDHSHATKEGKTAEEGTFSEAPVNF